MFIILVTFTAVILHHSEKMILNPFVVHIWWLDCNSSIMVGTAKLG